VIELFVRGGVFMYPILVCSIIGLAVFLERLWVMRRSQVLPEDLIEEVEALLRRRKVNEALNLCRGHASSIARVFLGGLKNAGRGTWLVKEGIQDTGGREAAALEKHVGVLATIANLTPLLGLLGTVSGMIKTFNVISVQGVGNPAPLAGGIAEALVTTASGLCVAIPTLVCYRILRDRSESLVFEMEEHSLEVIEILEAARREEQPGVSAAPSDPGPSPFPGETP
jgi:biopolymer transport protein ExbB